MPDLTTLANVKAFGNITGTDATRDALLSTLITSVSSQMDSYVGRTLGSATYTSEKIDGSGFTDFLALRNFPVTTFTSLAYLGTTIDSSTYEVDTDAGLIYRVAGSAFDVDDLRWSAGWVRGRRNYAATYTAGYSSIPGDLSGAANRQVLLEYKRSGYKGDRIGLITTQLSDGSVATFAQGEWAEGVQGVLDRYRRVRP